jgi:hypothetical protein
MIFKQFEIFKDNNMENFKALGADRCGQFNLIGSINDKSDGWGSNITFNCIKQYIGQSMLNGLAYATLVYYSGTVN